MYKRQTMQFPFAIFLLTGFLRSIPRDYEEAAMIDGCGPFRILTSIIIPTVSYTHLLAITPMMTSSTELKSPNCTPGRLLSRIQL